MVAVTVALVALVTVVVFDIGGDVYVMSGTFTKDAGSTVAGDILR